MFKRLQEIRGKHVVAMEEGRDMGIIHKVYLDPQRQRVSGITVRHGRFGGDEKWLDIDKVRRMGEDFLLIDRAEDCREKIPRGRSLKDLMGAQVTTRDGKILGTLLDVEVDQDWKLREIDLPDRLTVKIDDGEAVFGTDAVMLKAGSRANLQEGRGREQGFLARLFGKELVHNTTEIVSRTGKKSATGRKKAVK